MVALARCGYEASLLSTDLPKLTGYGASGVGKNLHSFHSG